MSSLSKAPSSKSMTSESPEESGWTTYFEDFFNNQNNIEDQECTMSFSGVDSSSSLVSDAASLAAKKLADTEQVEFPMSKNGNRSSFKKRKKIKTALVDDTLEDTASSPVNSPKVLHDNQLYKEKQKELAIDFSQEKGNTSGQRDERKESGLNGRDSDCTELKKRGLCLVPLSMLVKYLG